MPYCCILECKNDSRRKNLRNGGVSYHRFPKDATVKEKWIDATGRINWMPTKSSTICSEHFIEDDILISNKGYKYTKLTAFPTLKIVKLFNQTQMNAANSSKRQGGLESSEFKVQPKKKNRLHKDIIEQLEQFPVQQHSADSIIQPERDDEVKNIEPTAISHSLTPRKKKLKGQLRFCQSKIKKQSLKIKLLQTKNQRLV